MPPQLKKPPLIEAILEIKWEIKKLGPDTFEDEGYKLASGRLFDKISKKFGYIKNLPITIIPEELTGYSVRHQFRASENGWPLVQLGPGIATVNFTPPYTWKMFKGTVRFFVPQLSAAYKGVVPGDPDYQLRLNRVMLRYVNAVEFDWPSDNALEFLSNKLHTNFNLPPKITETDIVSGSPNSLNLQIGYPISEPKGQCIIRLATGSVRQENGLIWELMFLASGKDAPQLTNIDGFMAWVDNAHDVVERWFFSLIEGDLHKQFKGE